MNYKKNNIPDGAAVKGDYIKFVIEGVTYTGYVIGVYTNSVSVEVDGNQVIRRKKETYSRTVVKHSDYEILPSK